MLLARDCLLLIRPNAYHWSASRDFEIKLHWLVAIDSIWLPKTQHASLHKCSQMIPTTSLIKSMYMSLERDSMNFSTAELVNTIWLSTLQNIQLQPNVQADRSWDYEYRFKTLYFSNGREIWYWYQSKCFNIVDPYLFMNDFNHTMNSNRYENKFYFLRVWT